MNENLQEEQVTKIVTPVKLEEVDEWGFIETKPPIGGQESFRPRKWFSEWTEGQDVFEDPKEPKRRKWGEPRTPINEQERSKIDEEEKSRIARAHYESDQSSFFDGRWIRTVYWDPNDLAYKPRNLTKPVVWSPPKDWKPETEEEFKQRTKFWYPGGIRLYHKDVLPGAIYRFFEGPEYAKVRVTHVFRERSIPKVLVKDLDGSNERFIFADELERSQVNSKRSRKSWIKRQRSTARKNRVLQRYSY